MKLLAYCIAITASVLVSSCASSPSEHEPANSQGAVMLFTSDAMNARSQNELMNSKMKEEVATFATSLRSEIINTGRLVTYVDVPKEVSLASMVSSIDSRNPGVYSYIGQIYWSADPQSNIYISVSFLPMHHHAGGVKFGKKELGRQYFILGKGKYSDKSAAELASEFASYLRDKVLISNISAQATK